MALPLTGIRVLDLSRLLPGPFCSQVLADFGAEVIKVEDTGVGDYTRWMPPMLGANSALFYAVNRGKKSLRIDLKTEQGREIFRKLAARSDVLLESFRPGVMESLNLGYEQLKQIHPGLIYCALTGYGQSGPYRNAAGHDINYLNLAGISALIGNKEGPPAIPAIQIADIGGGSLWSVIAILLALKAREMTGEGQMCDVAMLDGVMSWLAFYLATYSATGLPPARGKEVLNGGYACYNIYPTSDQKYVSLGAMESKFWAEFCRRMGKEDFISQQNDPDRQEEMIQVLSHMFREKTQSEWVAFFAECDICFTPVLEMPDLIDHPQVQERRMLYRALIEDQEIVLPGIPIKLSLTPGRINPQFSNYGDDTAGILRSLEYSPQQIEDWKRQGVL